MMDVRGARALVAGGAGFLGSHLCELLTADGLEVVCLDNFQTGARENLRRLERNPRFDLVEADVSEPLPKSVENGTFDLVFNLAATSIEMGLRATIEWFETEGSSRRPQPTQDTGALLTA